MMRLQVRSLASLHGLRIGHCRELWSRLQTRLGSRVAVTLAWAVSYSSIRPLAWESPYAASLALKRKKKKKKKVAMIYQTNVIEKVQEVCFGCFMGKETSTVGSWWM